MKYVPLNTDRERKIERERVNRMQICSIKFERERERERERENKP